jgi:hypothetical protein
VLSGRPKDKTELSSRSEKFLQEFCALSGEDAAPHFNLVIERGVVQNVHGGMHRSSFWILGAIDEGTDPGVHHGSCTHGTGLDSYKQIAVSQAVIAQGRSGFAQRDYFCVGSWVGVGQIAIESAPDDLAFMNYDCAYRNFTQVEGSLSGPQGLLHPQFVGFGTSAVPHEQYCMRMVEPSAFAQMD